MGSGGQTLEFGDDGFEFSGLNVPGVAAGQQRETIAIGRIKP